MASVGTVTISGTTYSIYGSLSEAKDYARAAVHFDAWDATSGDTPKAKALVTATRMLDRVKSWVGSRTDTATPQPLQWPRTGVTDRDGNAVSDSVVPDEIAQATYELANALLDDEAVQSNTSSGSNIKSVKAGPVNVDFFQPTAKTASRFPTIVQELISFYLVASTTGIIATGTDEESAFAGKDFGFTGEALT